MSTFISDIFKKVLIWLLLLAIVDSAVLYLSYTVLEMEEVELAESEMEEVELAESEMGESEKSEKETDEEDSKVSPQGFYASSVTDAPLTTYSERNIIHTHHLEICSPPPERG